MSITTTPPAPAAPSGPPTIFTQSVVVPQFLANRLTNAIARLAPGTTFDPQYLWWKILAAEKKLSDDLRVWFQPRQVLPDASDPSIAAGILAANPAAIIEYEPGYDYDPSFFGGDRWGLMELRHRPSLAVQSIYFQYPTPGQGLWYIPPDWVRLDKKFGHLNLVPTQNTIAMPLNAYILSVLGGGRKIPLMLQVQYTAGLENVLTQWPEIVDLILKMAALSVLDDLYLPSSRSQSIDGLSQSISFDPDKIRTDIDNRTELLRQKISGPRMMILA